MGLKIRVLVIAFWMIAGLGHTAGAFAQVHGCTPEGAEDRTGEAEIELQWGNPHDRCVLVSPGTTVTWDGNFNIHPLAGGVTPVKDDSSPISSPGDDIGSVAFNDEGTFPYFCRVHTGTMTGVIYVAGSPPGDFNKLGPANGANDQPLSTALSWGDSSGADSYEYCIDQSANGACDSIWNDVGASTSANPAGLSSGTTYQWQARALNDAGITEADSGTWWQFTTVVEAPGPFSKSSPADGAVDQSTAAVIAWAASSGASEYEYCLDTSENGSCNASWVSTGGNTSVTLEGLSELTTYEWQVRAINAGGSTEANAAVWWDFTTLVLEDGFEPDPP